MNRSVALACIAALGTLATRARAEQFDFFYVLQQEPLKGGNLNAAYAAGGTVLYQTVEKPGAAPGTGGGGGTGQGRKSYQGVRHKMYAYAGLTRWLMLGLEQSMTAPSSDGWSLGVMAPEVRFKLLSLESNPVGLSLFSGPRLRFNARRTSTVATGLGIEAGKRALGLAANVAFETTAGDTNRENGVRYNLGVRFPVYQFVSGAVEAWGVAVWSEDRPFQTDFHLGPTLKLRVHRSAWIAGNGMWGIKELSTKTFYDYGGMAMMGMAF